MPQHRESKVLSLFATRTGEIERELSERVSLQTVKTYSPWGQRKILNGLENISIKL